MKPVKSICPNCGAEATADIVDEDSISITVAGVTIIVDSCEATQIALAVLELTEELTLREVIHDRLYKNRN